MVQRVFNQFEVQSCDLFSDRRLFYEICELAMGDPPCKPWYRLACLVDRYEPRSVCRDANGDLPRWLAFRYASKALFQFLNSVPTDKEATFLAPERMKCFARRQEPFLGPSCECLVYDAHSFAHLTDGDLLESLPIDK